MLLTCEIYAQQTFSAYYDLSTRYLVCNLTGKETEYVVPLSFHSGKIIDEKIYEIIHEEFDSVMQNAFDEFWERKYIEYELTRNQNEYEKKQTQIQLARINLLKAQFEYDEELGVPIDTVLLNEYCELIDINKMWLIGRDFCSEMDETTLTFDSTAVIYYDGR